VLVPDAIELKRAVKLFSASLVPGVTLGHLREASPSGLESFARAFGGGRGGGNAKPPPAGAYFVVNASTIELPDVEAYTSALAVPAEEGGAPVTGEDLPAMVLWNMELDTLRADLGENGRREEGEGGEERGERGNETEGVSTGGVLVSLLSRPQAPPRPLTLSPPSPPHPPQPHPPQTTPPPPPPPLYQACSASRARTSSTASCAASRPPSTSAPATTPRPCPPRPF